ncbi:ABC transporter permease [Paraburkholderia caffeinilytica]|uniref:ABC transporter permease protein y4mJ n=1 Tax=Paraburkholderia caffeinilytica TaxID=1761016 RepID=A0ABQ1LGV2_9BURK|nr:ABC transporter permease [Paraburkholderia caffeinilytica]GGC24306.1 putative ABC transporter permease protein y4mJ [Paraburkholderia caffeinilytica]CAB3776491.1 Ribose import permease protein RbsC [Paraburkholderia caffeinilytica]
MKTVTHPIASEGPQSARTARRLLSTYRTEIAIAIAIIIIELAVGMVVPAALSGGNIANVTQAAAPLVLMAFGVLLVIITGGIDLSVGSVFSLTGMVTGLAMMHGFGAIASSLAGLSVGLLIGLINGGLVTFVGLAPFVVTLSTYAIAGSLSFIVTDGHSLPISDPNYYLLNSGSLIPGLPNYALWCVLLLVAIEFCLHKVVAGRWLYAVGSSSSSARVIGVPVNRVRLSAYLLSGLLASFAGIVSISYISNAEATAGSSLMLQAIAAVVIGGASLFGGTGSAIGALLGSLMITIIQNGANLIGVNSFWQGTVTGIVILIAVLVDRITKARR